MLTDAFIPFAANSRSRKILILTAVIKTQKLPVNNLMIIGVNQVPSQQKLWLKINNDVIGLVIS